MSDPCAEERQELIARFWELMPPDPEAYSRMLDRVLKLLFIGDLREIVDQMDYADEEE